MNDVLKIFGAHSWHDSVSIVGNRVALEKLKKLIEQALDSPSESFSDDTMESDGEGYIVEVFLHDHDFSSGEWDKLPVHYHGDLANNKINNQKFKNLNLLIDKTS